MKKKEIKGKKAQEIINFMIPKGLNWTTKDYRVYQYPNGGIRIDKKIQKNNGVYEVTGIGDDKEPFFLTKEYLK